MVFRTMWAVPGVLEETYQYLSVGRWRPWSQNRRDIKNARAFADFMTGFAIIEVEGRIEVRTQAGRRKTGSNSVSF
jgi:hypothetical protein